ncbi:MAG: hypothetical protein COV44_09750 [Deltaproteobacteria bacterium CG11_big_fil_rev_8_21_14_0_20_45_16]|nr:MAG: hypothetical protein COV44_09750 [Deltaproteobacteria bacterium CG11_big_fil_rev_8_21_14_0_20_45_16]
MPEPGEPKKRALIFGSTGLTGSFLVRELLNCPDYEQVLSVSRRPLDYEHGRLKQILINFESILTKAAALKADDVYCCLGTTLRKAGSRERFREVDLEFPLRLARLAVLQGAKTFSLVSAEGADQQSFFYYLRVKAELEAELLKIPFRSLHIFRPSILGGKRAEDRLLESMSLSILKFMAPILPSKARPTDAAKLAKFMLEARRRNEDRNIIYSADAISREIFSL